MKTARTTKLGVRLARHEFMPLLLVLMLLGQDGSYSQEAVTLSSIKQTLGRIFKKSPPPKIEYNPYPTPAEASLNDKPVALNQTLPSQNPINLHAVWDKMTGWITYRKVPNQDDVAAVHLAFLGIRPWEDVKSDLEANFNLTETDALGKVLPVVGNAESSLVDVLNTTGKLAGPSAPSAPSLNNAGTLPTSLIPGDTSVAQISGIGPRSTTIGVDPFLQYRAALSLKQTVTLLNNTIKNAPTNKGYDAYVVSLQVSLMPYQRDQPYDAYTDITFINDDLHPIGTSQYSNEAGGEVPRVIPLLVTDDLEAVSGKTARRNISQLSLALAAASPQVAGSGTFQKYKDAVDKYAGEETNALLTVARLSENIFRVRFGASNQDTKLRYAMVPQAHTVHILLLFPKDLEAQQAGQSSFHNCVAIANTQMRDARNGKMLRKPYLKEILKTYYDAASPFVQSQIFSPDLLRADNLLELSNYVRVNEYQNFQNKAVSMLSPDIKWVFANSTVPTSNNAWSLYSQKTREAASYNKMQKELVGNLWSSLAQVFGRSVASTDRVQLPWAEPGLLSYAPPVRAYLFTNDGSKYTTRLTDFKNLTSDNLSKVKVQLKVMPDALGIPIFFATTKAPSIDLDGALSAEFAGFDKLKTMADANTLKMVVTIDGESQPLKDFLVKIAPIKNDPAGGKPVAATPGASIKASSTTITQKADGTGSYSFYIEIDPKSAYNYKVTMQGAGLVTQPPICIPSTVTLVPKGDGVFQVASSCLINVQLQNFTPQADFTIALEPGDYVGKPPAPKDKPSVPDPFKVTVVPPPSPTK